tara:strand:- start:4673 stop:4957 length:285 start_codon:yes stop_codon:yes gene_type:complete
MTTLSKDEVQRLWLKALKDDEGPTLPVELFASLCRADLVAEIEWLKADADRMHWIAMHGTFGVDSVTGEVGGNGQTRKAATRHNIDASMKRGEA